MPERHKSTAKKLELADTVHSEILQLTTKTQKTYCGDALKIRTQSACLGFPHPPKTPLLSSSGIESQAQAETECGPPAETVGLSNSNRQPCSECNCGTPGSAVNHGH